VTTQALRGAAVAPAVAGGGPVCLTASTPFIGPPVARGIP
jgi:hypothetical protein